MPLSQAIRTEFKGDLGLNEVTIWAGIFVTVRDGYIELNWKLDELKTLVESGSSKNLMGQYSKLEDAHKPYRYPARYESTRLAS